MGLIQAIPNWTPTDFTATGSLAIVNTRMVYIDMVAGGGGGGGGHDTAVTGGGGGGGSSGICYIQYPYPVNPGDTLTVNVGAGGAAGAGGSSPANGSSGVLSSVGGSTVQGVGTLKAQPGRAGIAGGAAIGGVGAALGTANNSLLWAAAGGAAAAVGVFNTSFKTPYAGIMQSGGGGGTNGSAAGAQAGAWGDFIAVGVANGGGPGGCNQLGTVTAHTGGIAAGDAPALPANAWGFGGGGGGGTSPGGSGAAGHKGLVRVWVPTL